MGTIQPSRFLSYTGKILPGVRRIVNVEDPSAGDDWQVTVPAGVQWGILAALSSLNVAADGGQEIPYFVATVNDVTVYYVFTSMTVAASTVSFLSGIVSNVPMSDYGSNHGSTCSIPYIYLPQGATFGTYTADLQSDDRWENISLWVEEIYVTDEQLSEIARERAQLEREIAVWEYDQATQNQQGA